jgi:hypothetical protein
LESAPTPWASHVPLADTQTGEVELFEDPRVRWAIGALGGVSGASCVELGPLEGGHTYMLEQAGAAGVIAIEANRDSYLKCLVTKELLELRRCRFLCGDAVEYLRAGAADFDVCWCAGLLYQMVEPVELLELISRRASRLYIWTHYYDAERLSDGQDKSRAFTSRISVPATRAGFRYTLHRHDYGVATRFGGFWGGTQAYSNWLSLEDLLGALEHFGWSGIESQLEEDHPHGPAVNLIATRR